jgi:hypothetical protein
MESTRWDEHDITWYGPCTLLNIINTPFFHCILSHPLSKHTTTVIQWLFLGGTIQCFQYLVLVYSVSMRFTLTTFCVVHRRHYSVLLELCSLQHAILIYLCMVNLLGALCYNTILQLLSLTLWWCKFTLMNCADAGVGFKALAVIPLYYRCYFLTL